MADKWDDLKNKLLDKNLDSQLRYNALYAYLKERDPQKLKVIQHIIEDNTDDKYFRRTSIRELGRLDGRDEEIKQYLSDLRDNKDWKDIALVAFALKGEKEILPDILQDIISSPDIYYRIDLANAFREGSDLSWKKRAEMILTQMKELNVRPETIDHKAIIGAIIDENFESRSPVIDYLIIHSIKEDSWMTSIHAKLILMLCDGDQNLAGHKISELEKSSKFPTEEFNNLRIAIGGEVALDPLLKELKHNLEEYFQKPIKIVNEDTRKMWETTIKHAQYGFITRMSMSVIVFIVGIILIGVSSWEFFYGQSTASELWGVGISFAAGLSTMLVVIYSGPLREIRESINDLGIASAAFIAYVHRILEISHTFSFYYLNQKITYDEMTKSSKLIDEAMKNTIELLSKKSAKESK